MVAKRRWLAIFFSVILVLNASSGISGKTHLVELKLQHFLCSKQKEEPQVWFFFYGSSKRETVSKLLLDVESIFLEFLGRPS